MTDIRPRIIEQYSEWTALSALRSGAPIKSRRDVYGALRQIDFAPLFAIDRGPISTDDFDRWHEHAVSGLLAGEPRLTVGWAAKILNIYLKTRCYVGAQGRSNLSSVIHPPIDGGLWEGLRRRFPNRPDILDRSNCVSRIKDIVEYDCYERIIDGCRAAAGELNCKLIEVDQLWVGTEFEAPPS